ncbi:hypothetical protein PGTUg99_016912 [Puccinia graminis f. sp. tritici]|uniref:Uncharacterized protein n=1 Tax=Puccinia graminis f. sp. tritici TaxID=56615 RepID=A0A5B0RYA4_PUCGR|nr:hypothetical protein PGTUg99_016912 [Puccinia graminis f. sp. tritici]
MNGCLLQSRKNKNSLSSCKPGRGNEDLPSKVTGRSRDSIDQEVWSRRRRTQQLGEEQEVIHSPGFCSSIIADSHLPPIRNEQIVD